MLTGTNPLTKNYNFKFWRGVGGDAGMMLIKFKIFVLIFLKLFAL